MSQPLYIAEIDLDELTLIVAEAAGGLRRPDGMSVEEALDDLRSSRDAQEFPDLIPSFVRVAHASAGYIMECLKRAQRAQ